MYYVGLLVAHELRDTLILRDPLGAVTAKKTGQSKPAPGLKFGVACEKATVLNWTNFWWNFRVSQRELVIQHDSTQ